MLVASALGVTLLLLAAGCARRRDTGSSGNTASNNSNAKNCCPCTTAGQRTLDAKLMSLLASARAYHHKANLQLRGDDRAGAIASMRALLALGLDSRWPEAEEVRLDAKARLAKLLLADGKADQALVLVDAELAETTRPSFYLANLHAVRGELLEARAKALDNAGKKDEGKTIARDAIAAFERSIAINKQLQRRLGVGGNGSGSGSGSGDGSSSGSGSGSTSGSASATGTGTGSGTTGGTP
ncbi:MAG: hypothetical protein KC503_23340 [Myxococcales bacterium]|nr:hypothetical protein [Myxococcales bacterium]